LLSVRDLDQEGRCPPELPKLTRPDQVEHEKSRHRQEGGDARDCADVFDRAEQGEDRSDLGRA
jgi:hypothetical protein